MVKRRLVAGILSAAVSIMQLVPSFTLISYAATGSDGPTVSVVENVSDTVGQRVEVDLELTGNPGFNALMVKADYDADALEFYDVTENSIGPFSDFTDAFSYADNEKGTVTLNWASEEDIDPEDGVLATLVFYIKDDAKVGAHPIHLYTEEGNNFIFTAPDTFKDYTVNFNDGSVGVIRDIEDVVESVYIGSKKDAIVGKTLTPKINLKPGIKEEDLGEIKYSWYSRSIWENDEEYTDKTYTVRPDDVVDDEIYVDVSAEYCGDTSIRSNSLSGGKPPYDEPLDEPNIQVYTYGFEIDPMPDYDIYPFFDEINEPDPDDDAWTYLDEGWFEWGEPGVTYYVYIRHSETDSASPSDPMRIEVRIPSDDATLASLDVSDGAFTFGFEPDYLWYDVIVPMGIDISEVEIYAVPNEPHVKSVDIEYATDYETDNVAYITVTPENEDELAIKVYELTFYQQERSNPPEFLTDNDEPVSREGFIGINAPGATIYYSAGSKKPSTSGGGYSETVYVDVAELNIPATQPTVTINAVAVEEGKAESEVVSRTFKLIEADAALSEIRVNGDMIEGFAKDKKSYTYAVSYSDWIADPDKVYKITAEPSDSSFTVAIEDSEGYSIDEVTIDESEPFVVIITVTTETGATAEYTVTFEVSSHEHVKVKGRYIAPTCTEAGYQYYVCEICDESLGWDVLPAEGHKPGEWEVTKEASCSEEGERVRICTVCKKVAESEPIPKTDHTPGEWEVTEATCEDDGERVRYCTVCGEVAESEIIPATGHSWSEWLPYYDDGYDNEYRSYCDNCGEYRNTFVSDTSHIHSFHGKEITIVEADCQTVGEKEVYCSVPDCEEYVTEPIPKTDHDPLPEDIDIEPTCTEPGHAEIRCSVCNVLISERTVPAAGHTYNEEDWESDEIGHWHECIIDFERGSFASHTPDEGVITVEPTETTEGEITYYCSVCGYELNTETIPALGESDDPNDPGNDDPNDPGNDDPNDPGNDDPNDPGNDDPNGPGYNDPSDPGYDNPSDPGYSDADNPIGGSTMGGGTAGTSGTSGSLVTKEPYIPGEAGLSGWAVIEARIDAIDNGGTVNVNMNGATELPESVLNTIQGKDVDLVINMGNGFKWRINGLDVTNANTVNMGAAIVRNKIPTSLKKALNSEEDVVELRLYHNGDFGFTAELSFDISKKYNDYYATLYYYNTKTGELEYTGSTWLVSKNNVTFSFPHASYYAIGFSKDIVFEDVSAAAASTAVSTSPIDMGVPVSGGTGLPQGLLPGGLRLSNKKRRYRVVRKRKLDDLVFVL